MQLCGSKGMQGLSRGGVSRCNRSRMMDMHKLQRKAPSRSLAVRSSTTGLDYAHSLNQDQYMVIVSASKVIITYA